MATIRLTNDDIRMMISEAVARLLEGTWHETEPLCRLPYLMTAGISDHAIDREYERDINEDDIIDDLKLVVRDIINDYRGGRVTADDYIKVIDRDTCVVAVCGIRASENRKYIRRLAVVTAYIWDGRINIDKGNNYYVNGPSREWLEAERWNRENQDKVISYMEWKRGTDVARQRRKAEKEYHWRTHPMEASPEKRMRRVDNAFACRDRRREREIEDSLPYEDLKAIRDYYKFFNRRQLSSPGSVNRELWADDYRRRMEREALAETARQGVRNAPGKRPAEGGE